jgi:RND family efflux transporter MFP subunit
MNPYIPKYFVAAAAVLALSSCGQKQEAAEKPPDPPIVTVSTTPASLRPMADHLVVSSELVPFQEIDVYAKVAGFVKELNVDYGSRVRKGQVLAVLEIPELEAQLQEDNAAIKAQSDEVSRAGHEIARVKAQQNVFRLQYERLAGVAKSQAGLVAQQEVDDAEGKKLAADSQVEAAQGAYDAAQSQLVAAKAKLMRDQAMYDYSKVTAPFDGVVTQRYANFGALIQAGTSTTQSMPLVRLSQENLYRLVIPVPETYVKFIRVNDPVEVRVPSLGTTVTGKVARFSVDVNMATRTMHTEVDVPNPGGKLIPGTYAEADLTLNQRGSVLTVPIQAIDRSGDNAGVMVVQSDGTVARRPVTLGLQTADYVEVAGGLSAGDQVILSDRGGLRPGQRVSAHPSEALAYDTPDNAPKN